MNRVLLSFYILLVGLLFLGEGVFANTISVNNSGDGMPPQGEHTLRSAIAAASGQSTEIIISPYITSIQLTAPIDDEVPCDLTIRSFGPSFKCLVSGGWIRIDMNGKDFEMYDMEFHQSFMVTDLKEAVVEDCEFKFGTHSWVGGLGFFHDSEYGDYIGEMTVKLRNVTTEQTGEDGIQIKKVGGDDVHAELRFCSSNDQGDDGFEVENPHSKSLLAVFEFCGSDNVGNSQSGANYNINEDNSGSVEVQMLACDARWASDSNIEIKERKSGVIQAHMQAVDVAYNSAGEGLELREEDNGFVDATLNFVDIGNAKAQGLQMTASGGAGQANHSLTYYAMDIVSCDSKGADIEITENATLNIQGGLGSSFAGNGKGVNKGHGLRVKNPGNVTINLYDNTFSNNDKDGIHVDVTNANAVLDFSIDDSALYGNGDEAIQLEILHNNSLQSRCSVTGNVAFYIGGLKLNPTIVPPPNGPGVYGPWKLEGFAHSIFKP